MTTTSRRRLLGALAATAAAVPLQAVAPAAAHAAPRVDPPVEPFTPSAGAGSPAASSVTLAPLDGSSFAGIALGPLATAVLPGTPERTEVTADGARVALLTKGARTVLVSGPRRTFREDRQTFTDDFARTIPDRSSPDPATWTWGWGASPGGGSWSDVNGADSDYEVSGDGSGTGVITLSSTNVSRHVTVRDDAIADVDVRATARFDKAPASAAYSYALSFGYQDSDNSYRARLYFTAQGALELRLERERANSVTQLAPAVVLPGTTPWASAWTIRVRREGERMRAKAWRAGTTEPAAWSVEATDGTFGEGRVGIRAIASTGSTQLPVRLLVDRFSVDAASWADPPVVTHGDWVRVLPTAFDGTWSDDLDQRIRAWAGSTAPDVLSFAAMFLPGAPAVRAGSGPAAGKQVLGEAGYGYLDPQGYRYEGADFHEYMNTAWTFPTRTVPASAKQVGNLDCSGYVRMVYGYHHGVPMAAGEDTSGTRLPRKSRDMVDHTPGTRIARATPLAPPATFQPPAAPLLQPGDLLFFNADSADDLADPTPDDGGDDRTFVIDHVGIHLGVDAHGNRRFLSSRKTGDGPTMGDLAGASTLEGTGVYARNLHTVHRI